jgi:hypothetical protein
MKSTSILWLLLIPMLSILLILVGVVIWSEISGITLRSIYNNLRDPNIQDSIEKEEIIVTAHKNESMIESKYNDDPISAQLDNDAHVSAMVSWCTEQGWKHVLTSNSCLAPDKEACAAKSTDFVDYNDLAHQSEHPFLVWSNGNCLETLGNQNTCSTITLNQCIKTKNRCSDDCMDSRHPKDAAKNKIAAESDRCQSCIKRNPCNQECDKGYNTIDCIQCGTKQGCKIEKLEYIPMDVKCDEGGFCSSNDDCPKCRLTEAYCTEKGVAYDSDNNGDCYVKDTQAFAEVIFGKSITRQYKMDVERLLDDCKNNGPLSRKCIKAQFAFEGTYYKILFNSIKVGYRQSVENFKNDCLHGGSMPGKQAVDCVKDALDFFPGFWEFDKGLDLVNKMLMFIPGMPNLKALAMQALYDFGDKVIIAAQKYGGEAAESIYHCGQAGISAIEKLGKMDLGGFLEDSYKFVKAGAEAILAVAEGVFAMLNIGFHASFAFAAGKEIYKIAKVIGIAIKKGAAALGTFVANVISDAGELWQAAVEKIGPKLGKFFGVSGRAFSEAIKVIGDTFVQIGNTLIRVIENVVKDIFCLGIFC